MFEKVTVVVVLFFLLFIGSAVQSTSYVDADPLVDIAVTLHIQCIRCFDSIGLSSSPGFFVRVFLEDIEYVSPVWSGRYLYDLNWSATCNVPYDVEEVIIKMQLYAESNGEDTICDLSGDIGSYPQNYEVNLTYSIFTGQWTGDDSIGDCSGYGRLNGCDDGSFSQDENDCELYFTITQTDDDGDQIPPWTEVNILHTDPMVNNAYDDPNHDGIPLWWDWRWGYDPFEDDNHSKIDSDQDGLDNYEEYLTSQWGSDPFRRDLFVEIDYMADSPCGERSILSEGAKELLRTAYDRRNIVYHLDDGCMGGGGEIIPFDELTFRSELYEIYQAFFLHNDPLNWRRGVFHYGVIIYDHVLIKGYVFSGDKTWFFAPGVNSFQISSKRMEEYARRPFLDRDVIYASAVMHETGHTLGIFNVNTPGCDNYFGKYFYQINFWRYRNYKSVMNYRYIYTMVDYSDGSHGRHDFDDWGFIDLTYFQRQVNVG